METVEELIHKIRGRTYETNDRFTLEIAYSDLEIFITESEQTAKYKELVKAQRELIEFYSKNISDNAVFLAVHHCGAKKEDVEKGVQLRKRITELNINLK